jgi:protease IV
MCGTSLRKAADVVRNSTPSKVEKYVFSETLPFYRTTESTLKFTLLSSRVGDMANEKRFGCLGIILTVVLCFSLLFNLVFIIGSAAGASSGSLHFREHIVNEPSTPGSTSKVAVIRLSGMISNFEPGAIGESMVEDIDLQLKHALEDSDVKSIILAIDSPGGEVTASDIIYNSVRAARAKKPVVVSMGSMAASGGYYIACGGSHIVAHDTTFTGSIGVIMQTLNYADLFGKVGLEMVTFKSGKFKDMLSGSRVLGAEEKEYVQNLVMQTYGKFVGIVARERKLPEEELRSGPADGRILSGRDALAARLIDQVGDFGDAVKKAQELGNAPGAAVVRYDLPASIGRYLRLLGKAEVPKKIEVNVGPQMGYNLQPGRIYLLPGIFAK